MHPLSTMKPLEAGRSGIDLRSEPFRLMFPCGILVGVFGVLLWPLFVWELLPYYPGPAHARLLIGGFFGAMILGFLGTAGPRMLSAPFLSRLELGSLFLLWAAAVGAAFLNRLTAADGLTAAVFLCGFFVGWRRFRQRRDLPPPGFVLVLMGLLCGFFGAAVNLGLGLGLGWSWLAGSLGWFAFGKLLFYEAFILLPILGVAPFFFPRFGGLPSPQAAFPEFRRPNAAWRAQAAVAAAFGVGIVASFAAESWGWPRSAAAARAAMILGYALWKVPLRYGRGLVGTLGRAAQAGTVFLVAGTLLPAVFPDYRVGLLHLLFMGGFALITLAVANWVIFGHSGVATQGRAKLAWVRWGLGAIFLALATRLSADLFPEVWGSHLVYAALAWTVGLALWNGRALPRVSIADAE